MKFYVTVEPYERLRKLFMNLGSFYILDVDAMLEDMDLNPDMKSERYVIDMEISRMITMASRSKRNLGIIYINSSVGRTAMKGLRDKIFGMQNGSIERLAVLDNQNTPRLENIYDLADEVVFFPTCKRTRITECKPGFLSEILKKHDNENV